MKGLVLFFGRVFLSLRYRVRIHNTDIFEHDGPILVLANHVALVDPMIVMSFVGKHAALAPLASEKYYLTPGIKQVMDIFGTVPVGDMSAGADALEVQKVFSHVTQALQSGKNILLYPSGQIYRQGYESIKGKQSAYQVIAGLPDNTKIIGIKTRGLWGSIWSKAWDNGNTSFFAAFGKSLFYICSNIIVFTPRRSVDIYAEDLSAALTRKGISLTQTNEFLEGFFNTQEGKAYEEELVYKKHFFYFDDVRERTPPEIISGSEADMRQTGQYKSADISSEIYDFVCKKISQIKEIPEDQIHFESNLVLDLYCDSLDVAEIKSSIQAHFADASNPSISDLKMVLDCCAMAAGLSQNTQKLKECNWESLEQVQLLRDTFSPTSSDTILRLWKKRYKAQKNSTVIWDAIFGSQKGKDVILKSYLIADYFKKIPGEYIGIMLPSVGSAPIILLAAYLAGKTPVMFNWTLGKDAFDHCVKFSKVEQIVTARSFFDKIESEYLQDYKEEGMLVFLEDLLGNITLPQKLSALGKSLYMPLPKEKEEAVMLFTSGSESLPKAVLLSQKNIIENLAGVLQIMSLKNDDILIGFLPPFHSFGFTVNTILPLISGIRVAYTPDPNDAKTILEIMQHCNVTGVTATPTFLRMILSLAQEGNLSSLRYAVVGAEKCPDEVFETFSRMAPGAKILEGYGITECSPVISLNPLEHPKPGTVGRLIPNLDILLLDVESGEEVSAGEQGMIYVSGSSVFSGYMDSSLESPFLHRSGKNYYKTGDLGIIDAEGYLQITGRLKRFIKIAGEMISLPFIESVLLEKFGSSEGVTLAVEALERSGEAKIVLFTTLDLKQEDINSYLRERGVSNLMKISEVMRIDEIPLLGTGKTDYKVLKSMIL